MFALILAFLAACAPGSPGPGIEVDRAIVHARELVALGPRPGDSDTSREAVAYLTRTLAELGVHAELAPVGTMTIPAIEVMGTRFRHRSTRPTTDPNIVTRFGPPTGKALLVMAHYDTVRGSPGAIDNAAAVGVLLELARTLATTPPATPVIIAFTANEEIGLVGAEALAAQLGDEVTIAISLDVIGGTGELSLNGASTLIGAAELDWLADAADRAGMIVRAPLAHRVVSRWWPQAERSDHGPFTRRGVRAFHLYHRGHDGELIDRAYHTERDDLERILPSRLAELGRLLRALVAAPPPARDGDGFWMPVAINTVVPRWSVITIELVLALFAIGALARRWGPRARGGLGLVAAIGCVALAIVVGYAIERATASTHPAPWLHAPRYHAIAMTLVLAGTLGLSTRLAARFAPWVGADRYLVVAVTLPLAIGLGFLALGAAELAWIWLVPAAAIALAPHLGRAGLFAVAITLLPAALVAAPDQLREAAWNGFAPATVPLVAWLVVTLLPVAAAVAWYVRHAVAHPTRPRPAGPLSTLVLPLGWALAMIIGILMLVADEPPCSAVQFHEFHLGCETRSEVR
ncbi:MAG: M20/M25/M40 family metallo-hydrolase [Deltaproteobacteria bacterium]|nr:M20/M25/M40 family metallo-hydrolase [Deltaproteobacteria bacterium]MDQ3296118.1 M28 family metallopeptidase [Myxococcota bacterium]